MRRLVILLALAAVSLGGATASATTCNIDFTATISQTAYDFAIVLPNTHATILETYNGTPGADDVFSGFSAVDVGPNKLLHWTSPGSPIVSGTRIHVGWTTSDNTCPKCVTGFFTDQAGRKIPGTDVSVLAINHAGVANNECAIPITLSNIRGACLSAPVSLSGLNRTNSALVAQLQDLSSGATVMPGTDFVFPLPSPPSGGSCSTYVFNYDIVGQSSAQISPWVELP
jgi:hypothetical protein